VAGGNTARSARQRRLGRAALAGKARVWTVRLILAGIALMMLVWLGKQAFTFCLAQAIRTQPAMPGVLSADYTGQAIILRNETVVTAPEAGSAARLVPEGARVRTGTAVVRISGAASPDAGQGVVDLTSPAAGDVCYHLDGWEGILTPKNCRRMDLPGLFKSGIKNPPDSAVQLVNDGEPVFKIIDNLVDPYLVIRLDATPGDLAVGSRVSLLWGNGGSGRGRLLSLESKPGITIAVVELQESNQDLSCLRTLKMKIEQKKFEGIVVPSGALVRLGNNLGVYTKSPLGISFTKVQLIGTLGDSAAVQGIPQGTQVVTNPGLARMVNPNI
jgi:putative membrane fusion protein